METRTTIAPEKFNTKIFDLFNRQWLLLAAGNFDDGDFNVMTVSWGFLGFIWQQPAAIAVVRPQRHTLKFMDKYDSFTLSAYPESLRSALDLCGSTSGSQIDKIAHTGLTPTSSEKVSAPSFAEAELVIECRKLYHGEFIAKAFFDKKIANDFYPGDDFHKVFVGGIKHISGIADYH